MRLYLQIEGATPTTKTKNQIKKMKTELRNEIANLNWAIKAFESGMKWLAPDELSEAPSIEWLKMQKKLCVCQLDQIKNQAA